MSELFARTFRFRVTLSPSPPVPPAPGSRPAPAAGPPLGNGAFQECSGLDLEMDIGEYVEGGRNNGVIQRAGRAKVARIVLRRGMFHPAGGTVDTALWRWFQDVVDGVRPLRRYDGTVEVLDEDREAVATWTFARGLPVKVIGPQLNARTGEVAVEELQIAHEGLRLEVS
ncbi:phage tail protein [Modestobacter altitudinis]|uniref:phage tail protein n=1 Tax=Modestobacter altitudinis TaxID=2213158 RepID=UPI00110D06A9|nr:phage tail protein [Modestobacter altitudinis]